MPKKVAHFFWTGGRKAGVLEGVLVISFFFFKKEREREADMGIYSLSVTSIFVLQT